MKTAYDIIIKPIITEKSSSLVDNNLQYTFEVDPKATKTEIKDAIEKIFKVKKLDEKMPELYKSIVKFRDILYENKTQKAIDNKMYFNDFLLSFK